MVDAAEAAPGTDPDRCGFTIALQTDRDQIVQAAAVATTTAEPIGPIGLIGRQLSTSPRSRGQLRKLPRGKAPVLDRAREWGHGREEVREVKVISVDGLFFPHARQVVRIHRKRRPLGAKKWQPETVYAVTALPAHQASPAEIACWARSHWITENTVHGTKDVTFAEDAGQIRE